MLLFENPGESEVGYIITSEPIITDLRSDLRLYWEKYNDMPRYYLSYIEQYIPNEDSWKPVIYSSDREAKDSLNKAQEFLDNYYSDIDSPI